jgi:hypothetical protein
MLKKITLLTAVLCLTAFSLSAKEFINYYELGRVAPTSPGAYRFGSLGYSNPAILSTMGNWSENVLFGNSIDEDNYSFGFMTNGGPFGVGSIRYNIGDNSFWDTRFNLGLGNRTFGLGIGYSWIAGDKKFMNLGNSWNIGFMYRPIEFLSIGAHRQFTTNGNQGETVAEVAVRPIPHYPLAFFADAAWNDEFDFEDDIEDLTWSAGLSWEVVDGIRLNGRYMSENAMYAGNDAVSVGIDVSFGRVGVAYQANAENTDDTDIASHTFVYRVSHYRDRNIFDGMGVDKRHKHIIINPSRNSLNGLIPFVSFGGSQAKLTTILKKFDKIKADKAIHTVYLNVRDFALSYAELWEVREKINSS